MILARQTVGAKVYGREGKSPDRQLRSQNYLNKTICAEDVTGLKPYTEVAELHVSAIGSGAFCKPAKVFRKECWRYQK